MTFHPLTALRVLLRNWRFLALSLVITLSAAAYQRLTGPTHPKTIHIGAHSFKALRSQETSEPAAIVIPTELMSLEPVLEFKRYPTSDPWTALPFAGDPAVAYIPVQPPAGKVEYRITVLDSSVKRSYPDEPVRLRYKDPVPLWILVPHVYSMFAALLFGAWALLEATLSRRKDPLAIPTATQLCTCFFILGGFILGPIVQKFAFGEYWTGFPFGDDFTDNKVLLSVLFWLVAFVLNFKRAHPKSAALSAVVMFVMYLIPHSFGGSQFDYSENKVKTGLQRM